MNYKTFIALNVLLAITALNLSNLALAAPIPLSGATYDEYVGVYSFRVEGTDQYIAESLYNNPSFSDVGSGSAYASASSDYPLSASVGINIQGADTGSGHFGALANINIQYQFAVEYLGDDMPDPLVPIIFSSFGQVSVNSNEAFNTSQTIVSVRQQSLGINWFATNYNIPGQVNGTFSFDETQTSYAQTDFAYNVYMLLESYGAGGGPGFFYTSTAYLDPSVEIDPTFAFADQYRVIHSSGINFVPLPSSFMLFLTALLLLVKKRSRHHL